MGLGGTSSQLVELGRTDEGSFEDLEDRESTRNGEEKLWQILAFRKHGQIQKGIETRQYWTKHRDQQWHRKINTAVIFSNSFAV